MKSFKAKKEEEVSFPEWPTARMMGKDMKAKKMMMKMKMEKAKGKKAKKTAKRY